MALTDWTGEDSGNNKRVIDSAVTKKGTGSVKFTRVATNNSGRWITRSVTDPQMRTLFWARQNDHEGVNTFQIDHDQYGALEFWANILSGVWRQFRCTFWYDSVQDKKFGRLESRDDVADAFTQIGGDEDFSAGKPVAGKIRIGGSIAATQILYIDDQIVQDARF